MAEEYTKSKEVSQLSAALDETSLEQARERFDAARAKVITLAPRERHGIGMQSEKTLHAVLKNYIDSDEDHQEIPIDRYIADIFSGDHIIEIQTANMNAMRAKLACFLPQYPVRVVYPIPAKKQIIWVDPETGEPVKKNRSPLRGSFFHAFRELYKIRPFLSNDIALTGVLAAGRKLRIFPRADRFDRLLDRYGILTCVLHAFNPADRVRMPLRHASSPEGVITAVRKNRVRVKSVQGEHSGIPPAGNDADLPAGKGSFIDC